MSDEETKRTWVPVVEPVKVSISDSGQLESHGSVCWASEIQDSSRASDGDVKGTQVFGNTWLVIKGSRLSSDGRQLLEINGAASRRSVGSSLELVVLREEHDQGALLSGEPVWNTDVEDCGGVGGDGTEVLGSCCGCRGGGGDGDDEVGVHVVLALCAQVSKVVVCEGQWRLASSRGCRSSACDRGRCGDSGRESSSDGGELRLGDWVDGSGDES